MTDLQYSTTSANGMPAYKGGGVSGKSNIAIMWYIPGGWSDTEKLIVHEFGHSLNLYDIFNDETLGKPIQGSSSSNYMDYNKTYKMYYKTQIKEIIDKLNR